METFDYTKYQNKTNQLFQNLDSIKLVDASSAFRDSTTSKLSDHNGVFYITETEKELSQHNLPIDGSWGRYDETLIPPYGSGGVMFYTANNPYNLKWLWRTDGKIYASNGKIHNLEISGHYQSSSCKTNLAESPYILNYDNLNVESTTKQEISDASWWAKTDIGAVACTTTGEHKICLRGPSDKIADFKEWLISITHSETLILAEDANLIISIAINGGVAKSLCNINWTKKIKNLFRADSTLN